VAVDVVQRYKCCLVLVRDLQGYLVIVQVAVEEAQQVASCGRVDDLVDARKREGVFREVTVEIGVVDTHSSLAGFLGYKHRVGEPNRVFTFTNESGN
jgi:hypothetical protein